MSNAGKQLVGIVIHADGTVPFEDDVAPHIRGQMLSHLMDHGAELSPIPGVRHVKIKNWTPELQKKLGMTTATGN